MEQRLRKALRAVSGATEAFLDTSLDRQSLLQVLVRAVTEAVPDLCLISLVEGETITIVALHDADPAGLDAYGPLMHKPRAMSQIAAAGVTGTVFVPRIDYDEMRKSVAPDSMQAMQSIGARSLIVVPLRSRGQLLGLMTVMRHDPALPDLDETDRELVEFLASHAALAVGNAKLAGEGEAMQLEIEATRFVDAVLENIPDMVFVKEATNLEFVRFNRAGEELLGVKMKDLLGKNDYDFFPKDEAEFFIAKDRETLAAGKLVDIPEEPIRTPAGERWLHTKKVPIHDAMGTPRYLLGISEDITERKRALSALSVAMEKAQAANKELEAFSYSVAHDLRSPLRAIDGFAQALAEDYSEKLDDTGRRHLERIRAAAQRMGTLIDDLLRLSRVTRAEHNPHLVSLSSLARIAVGQLERTDPDRKVDISIEDGIEVRADAKLLSIALDNLFGNAWKFTSKVEQPRIELGQLRQNDERVFFIRDNGAGFDMNYTSKLFGVFQRLHPMHEFPGTGIGLATVKRIIERHGGRIWAEAGVGRGATFFFTLGEGS